MSVHEKISQIMAELGHIPKTDKNEYQGYMYRGIEATLEALHPLLVSHSLTMAPRVLDVRTEVRQSSKGNPVNWCFLTVEYVFTDADDDSSTSCVVVGEAADSQDKSSGQAMSQAMKQAVFQTFVVPTGEPDPDGESPFGDPDGAPASNPVRAPAKKRGGARKQAAPRGGGSTGPTKKQSGMIFAKMKGLGLDTDEQRQSFVVAAVERSDALEENLTRGQDGEVSMLIDALIAVENGSRPLLFDDEDMPYPGWFEEGDEPF